MSIFDRSANGPASEVSLEELPSEWWEAFSPAALRAADERFQAERAFFDAHEDEFRERFPDEFVVVQAGAVLAHLPQLSDVEAELARRGLAPTDVGRASSMFRK